MLALSMSIWVRSRARVFVRYIVLSASCPISLKCWVTDLLILISSRVMPRLEADFFAFDFVFPVVPNPGMVMPTIRSAECREDQRPGW